MANLHLVRQAVTLLLEVVAGLAVVGAGSLALAADAKTAQLLAAASDLAERGDNERAVAILDQAIAADMRLAAAYYLRGRAHFCLGRVAASVADFDRYVELAPEKAAQQWERGISLYYAGKFAAGAKQFEDYQTYHDNDVENSTWRYLCIAREKGVAAARETLLPIEKDPRVPMMEIYALYRGESTPEKVLAVAAAGDPPPAAMNQRLFYAHLYIGLWHEAAGNGELAREHITRAAEKHRIGHYMHDVARIHAARWKKPAEQLP